MLLRTSSAGPPPTGGSDPVMAMSCSSTSQRSYPAASRRPTTSSIPRVPLAERPEQPGLRGLHERQLAAADARRERARRRP